MKYVLLYESADDVASKAPAQFPAHKERLKAFHQEGELLMVGTFGDPAGAGLDGDLRLTRRGGALRRG